MMENEPKVICVGTNLESEVALNGLIDLGANIVGVVTKPVSKAGSTSDYVDLHPICEASNIAVIDTSDINSLETLSMISNLAPDYIFTLGWSQLFKYELLEIPTGFVVGSHPSPLPRGRGRAPIPWTILQGFNESAVSLFKMDIGVDSGPLLIQKWFKIPPKSYAIDVYKLVSENLRNAFCELYEQLKQNKIVASKQDLTQITYRAKRSPEDGHIDFTHSAEEIEKLVRAVSFPYPGAYTYYQGKVVRIWKASLEDIPSYIGLTGQILNLQSDKLLVQAGDMPIWLYEFSDHQGNELPANSFKKDSKFGFSVEDELYRLNQEIKLLRQNLVKAQ